MYDITGDVKLRHIINFWVKQTLFTCSTIVRFRARLRFLSIWTRLYNRTSNTPVVAHSLKMSDILQCYQQWTWMCITVIDWLIWVVILRPTRHKIGHFRDISPSQSIGLVWKKTKPNTTKAHIHQWKKCTTTQKTKATFSRLLRHPAWKRSGSILKGKDK